MGGGGKLFGARRQMKNVRVASPKLDCSSRVFAKMTVCNGYEVRIDGKPNYKGVQDFG